MPTNPPEENTTETTEGRAEALVTPLTLKGFQDILPEDAIAFNSVVTTIRKVLERFGYLPIETPALEYLATLVGTAGGDTNKQIFRLKSPEHEDIALRFDLTVPFARVIAQYSEELKLPFRRYHVAPVWRADKPGLGRFRQFTQFDFDAAGSPAMAVDAEVIRFVCDAMHDLRVGQYEIQLNHRKVMDAMLVAAGIGEIERQKQVLRVIDKLEKIGMDDMRRELGEGRIDESGAPIAGLDLEAGVVDRVVAFLNISGKTRAHVVEGIRKALPETEATRGALAEVEEYLVALEALGVPEEHAKFTPSMARGLDYYTGPIFEAILPDARQFGSVMAGGRYDGLVRRFLGTDIPATGGSIGISRFLSALKTTGAMAQVKTTTQVMITVMQQDLMPRYLALASKLRDSGINAEIYFGAPSDKFRGQMALANLREIPVAVIIGSDEARENTVAIKNLRLGMEVRKEITDREKYVAQGKAGQVVVPWDDAVVTIKQMLD